MKTFFFIFFSNMILKIFEIFENLQNSQIFENLKIFKIFKNLEIFEKILKSSKRSFSAANGSILIIVDVLKSS